MEKLVKNILLSNSYYVLNRELIQKLGLIDAALLSSLCEFEKVYADETGWFFATAQALQESISIGRNPFESAIENLTNRGLITSVLKGTPAKKYFKLNYSNILELFDEDCPKGTNKIVQNGQTRLSEMNKQDCPKWTNKIVQNEQTRLSEMNKQDCPKWTNKIVQNEQTINKVYINKEDINKESKDSKEKIKRKGLDFSFVSPHFADVFNLWLLYKHERKQSYTQIGAEACYRKLIELSHNDPATAQAIVEQSIANNYQGLFELKTYGGNKNNGTANDACGNPWERIMQSIQK